MNELRALRNRVCQVGFICQLCERDRYTIEQLARFEASIKELDLDIDVMNEKNWIALDLIDRMSELFAEV